jgi:hypothetical protein
LIGPEVAVVCVLLGTGFLLLAGAGSEAAQRHVPTLGRLPFVVDYDYTAVPRSQVVSDQPPKEQGWELGFGQLLSSIVDEGETLLRRRKFMGDRRFAEAVRMWAGETDRRLGQAQADALREDFRRVDIEEPRDGDAHAAYLGHFLLMFKHAQDQLGEDEIPF